MSDSRLGKGPAEMTNKSLINAMLAAAPQLKKE